jgi:hypothetical protein
LREFNPPAMLSVVADTQAVVWHLTDPDVSLVERVAPLRRSMPEGGSAMCR